MSTSGVSGLLVTHPADVRYLCGFTGSNAALAVTGRNARLFTDGRYAEQAGRETRGAGVTIVARTPVAVEAIGWLTGRRGVKAVAVDAGVTTVASLGRWKASLPAGLRRSFLVPLAEPLVMPLRMVKDQDELAVIAEAALLGCELFEYLLRLLRPGLREIDIAAELEYKARMLGAEGMSFESIVASGSRSALPHGRATTARLPRKGFLTLDFGIIHKGYMSDMTRTVYFGSPKAREREVYDAVLEAQQAAVNAVGPGVCCGDVDEAARNVLRSAGLDEAFSHSCGHGVGLEIHEPPRVGAGQIDTLSPGMVITIEPGVYLEGRFGVRIEDMVEVSKTGGKVLTPAPKALIQI